MDPAAYAKVAGIQSEANKVTVTRVACGEIMYRRAVDTYRRDMRYKVNSLRREQKKLRRHMRGYRRKLREAWHGSPSDKEGKKKETLPSQEDGGENEQVAEEQITFRLTPSQGHAQPTEGIQEHSLSLLSVDRKPLPKGDDNVSEATSLLLGSAELTSELNVHEKVFTTEKTSVTPVVCVDVRRRVRGGQGIGAEEKNEDDADEVYSLLSDSSDDEDARQNQDDVNVQMVAFSNRGPSREKSSLSLVRINSAYFKPMDGSDEEQQGREILANNEGVKASGQSRFEEKGDSCDDEKTKVTLELLPKLRQVNSEKPEDTSASPLIVLPGIVDAVGSSSVEAAKPRPGNRPKKKGKGASGVSFGDLVKLSHGSNTKMLFSFVDRLASKNGVKTTPPTTDQHERLEDQDPRHIAALRRRANPDAETGLNSITTYGSVFYAMKFGYGGDHTDSKAIPTALSTGQLPSSFSDQRLPTKSFFSDTTWNTEQTSTVPPADWTSAPTGSMSEQLPGLDAVDGGESLMRRDTIDSQMLRLSEIIHGPRKPPSDPADLDILSNLSPSKQLSKKTPIVPSVNIDHSSSMPKHERSQRKSSLLEASKYIRNVQGRKWRELNEGFDGRYKKNVSRIRRGSTVAEQAPPMYQQAAAEEKVAWASAFGRIKLMHTIADVTHIM